MDAAVHGLLLAVSLESVRAGVAESVVRTVAASMLGAALFSPFAVRLREKANEEGPRARGRDSEPSRSSLVTIGVVLILGLGVVYLSAGIPQVFGVLLAFVAGVTIQTGVLLLRKYSLKKQELPKDEQ